MGVGSWFSGVNCEAKIGLRLLPAADGLFMALPPVLKS